MIGPLLVYIYEEGERSDELYYLYKCENGAQGIASESYINALSSDDAHKKDALSNSLFTSYDEIMDFIAHTNERELHYGYPDVAATYQVEYSFHETEAILDELSNI